MSRSSREAGAENNDVIIHIDNENDNDSDGEAAPVALQEQDKRVKLALILPDYLSSSLIMLTLTAGWFFELLQVLEALGHYKPSDLEIRTSYPLGITIFTASATAIAKTIDYHYPNANAMGHLLTLPSTSIVFFLIRLISNVTNYNAISLAAFIAVSSICIPMSALLFLKLEAPDIRKKNDPYYFGPLSTYQPPTYSDFHPGEEPTKIDRVMNISKTTLYCLDTATVFFWALNRELSPDGKSTPLYEWQYCATIIFLLTSAMMGYVLTEKTKAGQAFVAANKMIAAGACMYEAVGSVTNLIYAYHCPDYQFCVDQQTQKILSWIFFWLITFPLTLFMAASTRFDFAACDETNQKIKRLAVTAKNTAQEAGTMLELAVTDAKTTCGTAKEKMSSMCSAALISCREMLKKSRTALHDCFHRTKKKATTCCDQEELDPAAESILRGQQN